MKEGTRNPNQWAGIYGLTPAQGAPGSLATACSVWRSEHRDERLPTAIPATPLLQQAGADVWDATSSQARVICSTETPHVVAKALVARAHFGFLRLRKPCLCP
jgi:hypothetical protein